MAASVLFRRKFSSASASFRLPASALFVGLLAAACAGRAPETAPQPPEAPPAAPVELTNRERDAIAEILRLEDRREFVQPRFQGWFADSSEDVRRRAILAAARIGDQRAAPLLRSAIRPGDTLAANVAFALGQLPDSSAAGVQLLTTLVDSGGAVAIEALDALARMGRGREVIERTISTTSSAPVRNAAVLALWRYPRTPATLDTLWRFTAAPDAETRWRAVYVLTRGLAEPRAVDRLIDLSRDSDALVRALAVRGLRAPTADSAGKRAPAATALLAAVQDSHPHVRINAVRSLGGFADPTHAPAAIRLLNGADANVAVAAAEALGQIPGFVSVNSLESSARDVTRKLAVRAASLAALMRLDTTRAVTVATEWTRSPDWVVRQYAVRAFSGRVARDHNALLRSMVADPDPRVSAAALDAFQAAVDTASAPYAFYIEKLAQPDPGVRAAALRGLARRGNPADLDVLLQAYDRARRDTLRYAAVAAIDALAALERRGVPVRNSFFLRFPRPADALVHAAAFRRFGAGSWGPLTPVDTGHGLLWYRRVVDQLVVPALERNVQPRVRIRTEQGDIVLQLAASEAPMTVRNFLTLAARGYFNGTRWHRVVPNFVLQDGDPRGDGSGGPGYAIRDEINRLRYGRGVLGMALSGRDTGGSQFFITHSPQPHLDFGYTIFGRVVEGMDVADRVAQDDVIHSIDVMQ